MPGLKKDHRALRRRPLFTPVFLAGLASAVLLAVAASLVWYAGSVTVVMVRHAETAPGGEDPPLSEAGRDRAQVLARMLAVSDIEAIYTSEARRTRETAAPFAEQTGIEPVVRPAAEVEELARILLGQHQGETVLVVGHSNTLPRLADALGEPIPEIDHADHGNIVILRGGRLMPSSVIRLRF